MGRRGPKPQHSLDAVLDVAMRLIAERGLAELTLSRLARALGTSTSGLYRYFDGKEALMIALQRRAVGRYAAALQDRLTGLEPPGGDPVLALRRVLVTFGFYREHARAFPATHRLIDAFVSAPEPLLSDADARAVERWVAEILATCAQTLDDAVRAGALAPGDAMVRTHLLWAAMHGLGHFGKRDRIQPPPLRVPALVGPLLRALLLGFGAVEDQLAAAEQLVGSDSP